MILAVASNPAVDLTWHVDGLTPGATHRMPPGISRAVGGKGLNAARVLHQTGHEVLVLARAGGATGDELRADLEIPDLQHRLIPIVAATRYSLAIVDHADGLLVVSERGTPLGTRVPRPLRGNATRAGDAAVTATLSALAVDLSPEHIALADEVLVTPITEELR